MKNQSKILAIALALALGGCAMTETQKGTATGAGVGAVVGAVVGGVADKGKGAAIGAGVGAVGGAIAGNVWSRKMQAQKAEMEQATAGTGVGVSQTSDNRLKLDIPSDVSFDTGRADIKPNFRPILDKLATGLVDNPTTVITIIGHTDSSGSDAINNPLSVNRAASARDYLTARGVASNRISIEGRGSREPVASNDTTSGRAQNRRVEIYVAEPVAN
ncbi:MAG: OmpA family protein [Nitrosomonadales bacterium]|nr:OmpA family protein [Nitrosomonadales bacterium]